jgi:hypothetical protein
MVLKQGLLLAHFLVLVLGKHLVFLLALYLDMLLYLLLDLKLMKLLPCSPSLPYCSACLTAFTILLSLPTAFYSLPAVSPFLSLYCSCPISLICLLYSPVLPLTFFLSGSCWTCRLRLISCDTALLLLLSEIAIVVMTGMVSGHRDMAWAYMLLLLLLC